MRTCRRREIHVRLVPILTRDSSGSAITSSELLATMSDTFCPVASFGQSGERQGLPPRKTKGFLSRDSNRSSPVLFKRSVISVVDAKS